MAVAEKFEEIGSRLTIETREMGGWTRLRRPLSIDVRKDKKGEYFWIRRNPDVELEVLQADAKDRHLVLFARTGDGNKLRYLCGHDERHWFVSQVPEAVTTVRDAKAALRPNELRGVSLPRKQRGKRKTDAFVRQGEWFFVPAPELEPDGAILRNEPLQRNAGSKPHVVDECYRIGGEVVYVGSRFGGSGVTLSQAEFEVLSEEERRGKSWTRRVSGAEVYVRGKVRHDDHATIELDGWHRVLINGEGLTRSETVAFLD